MKTFVMLHGINRNMFGKHDPKQYGTITLEQINDPLRALARELGVTVVNFQSNIPVLEWIAICSDCVPSSRRRMPEIHSK